VVSIEYGGLDRQDQAPILATVQYPSPGRVLLIRLLAHIVYVMYVVDIVVV
jgi:hypothetical protein